MHHINDKAKVSATPLQDGYYPSLLYTVLTLPSEHNSAFDELTQHVLQYHDLQIGTLREMKLLMEHMEKTQVNEYIKKIRTKSKAELDEFIVIGRILDVSPTSSLHVMRCV